MLRDQTSARYLSLQVILVAMIALVSSASAQVVTNVFSGEVTKLFVGPDSLDHPANSSDGPASGGVFAGLRTGDPVSLSFVFDPLAKPIWTDSAGGYQYALLSWSIVA